MAASTGIVVAGAVGAGLAGLAAREGFYENPKETTTRALGLSAKPPSRPSLLRPTTAMPTPNQEKIKQSRLNSLAALQQRSGRQSTLLTTQNTVNNTFG